MSDPKRVLGLIVVTTVAAFAVTFVALSTFYRTAVEEERGRLEELLLGRREADEIVLVARAGPADRRRPTRIPADATAAERVEGGP